MPNLHIIQHRRWWYTFSLILNIGAIILVGTLGFRYGLDFTGGSLMEIEYSTARPDQNVLTTLFQKESINDARIQPSGDADFIIRLPEINEERHQKLLKLLVDEAHSRDEKSTVTEKRFESFGPTLGSELKQNAIYAIILVLIAIICYLAYAFRKVSHPVPSWKFGVVAVVALFHDVFLLSGLFSLLGVLYGTEIDSLFITALLTLLGFSVHDTIVTLDRVRENLYVYRDKTFAEVVDASINETVTRSINTSLTTLIVMVAVYFFGGPTIHNFSLALIFGIIVGTYSSIFIAAPLLVTWYEFSHKRKTS